MPRKNHVERVHAIALAKDKRVARLMGHEIGQPSAGVASHDKERVKVGTTRQKEERG